MKRQLLVVIFTILYIGSAFGQANFFKRFDFEIGINRSIVINQNEMFSSSEDVNQTNRGEEYNSYTNNYSLSLGFKFNKNHTIRLRHSKNKVGSHITGTFSNGSFCGFGMSRINLINAFNRIDNSTLGAMYEFQYAIHRGRFLFGLGLEKQWSDFTETIVFAPGIVDSNLAFHSSLGYLIRIFETIHFHPKFFTTYTLGNDHFAEDYRTRSYVPLQIGLELGLRLELN